MFRRALGSILPTAHLHIDSIPCRVEGFREDRRTGRRDVLMTAGTDGITLHGIRTACKGSSVVPGRIRMLGTVASTQHGAVCVEVRDQLQSHKCNQCSDLLVYFEYNIMAR